MNPVTSGTDSENYVVSIVTRVREQREMIQAGFIPTAIMQRLENESSRPTNATRIGMRNKFKTILFHKLIWNDPRYMYMAKEVTVLV